MPPESPKLDSATRVENNSVFLIHILVVLENVHHVICRQVFILEKNSTYTRDCVCRR